MSGKTTQQVAELVGKSKAHLITTLDRHPELKPRQTFGQNFVWTQEEIARLQAHMGASRRGRPANK
jgi:hypothetical protein